MKSKTQPLKITARLSDHRINSANGLVFLDCILYHGWFAKYAPEVLQDVGPHEKTDMNFGLPLRQLHTDSGIRYAASCGFYSQYGYKIEYWNKRPDFTGKNAKYLAGGGKIDTSKGELKAYHFPQVIRTVSDIEFYAMGNAEKIKDLLSYVPAIGKKYAAGWGNVEEWVVEEFDEDWTTDGKYGLMRPMPIEEYDPKDRIYTMGECAIRPPAWKACNHKLCYIPKVIINAD